MRKLFFSASPYLRVRFLKKLEDFLDLKKNSSKKSKELKKNSLVTQSKKSEFLSWDFVYRRGKEKLSNAFSVGPRTKFYEKTFILPPSDR